MITAVTACRIPEDRLQPPLLPLLPLPQAHLPLLVLVLPATTGCLITAAGACRTAEAQPRHPLLLLLQRQQPANLRLPQQRPPLPLPNLLLRHLLLLPLLRQLSLLRLLPAPK